jgi:ketosteroid isomerase-like protein
MSQANVEVVRAAIEAFNRHEFGALEEFCDEDFEFVSVFTAVDANDATYRGAKAWTDYAAAMDEMWTDWHVEEIRIFDAGDDRLVCLVRLVGTARLSGVPVDRPVGLTYRLRNGKLWRVRSYADPTEALEAAGLSE